MQNKELEKLWAMGYYELLKYLKAKYGAVPGNYFLSESCKSKNNKNSRTSDGLYIHHDYEYDPEDNRVCDLAKPLNASLWPWKYQLAENLTYCNWLEHLIIHIKINLLRKEQLGFYINDGVENYFIPELNTMYNKWYDQNTMPTWKLKCFSLVENDYEDYCWMIDEWFVLIGYPGHAWKNRRF